MNKPFRELRIITAGLVASTFALSLMPSAAHACEEVTIAGVQIKGNFKSNGAATTFLSGDPRVNEFFTYELQPGKGKSTTPYVGVNLPSLASGSLPNIGSFEFFVFDYEIPSTSPLADAGLKIYAQTSDGFIHIAPVVSEVEDSNNGFTAQFVDVAYNNFTPLITFHEVVKTINVRYSGSAAGTIFFIAPTIAGSQNTIDGFNFNTVNDTAFNN